MSRYTTKRVKVTGKRVHNRQEVTSITVFKDRVLMRKNREIFLGFYREIGSKNTQEKGYPVLLPKINKGSVIFSFE
jgi:hypothetical protein